MTEHPLETLCARCDKRLRDHFFVDCCEDETPRPDTPRFLSRHRPNERDAELSSALTAARAEALEEAAKVADRCVSERNGQIDQCANFGGDLGAVMAKSSEAARIAAALAPSPAAPETKPAKCATCGGSGVTSAPYELDAEDCPACGGGK